MQDVTFFDHSSMIDYARKELRKHLSQAYWDDCEEQIFAALFFAAGAHAGQVRKGSGVRYLIHPIHVASILAKYVVDPSIEMIQAALLHDTVEDTPVTVKDIDYFFGPEVSRCVLGMTKVQVPGNRAARKAAERKRLGAEIKSVQMIKAADIYSNTKTMKDDDPGFFPQYFAEQELLFAELTKLDYMIAAPVQEMFDRMRP